MSTGSPEAIVCCYNNSDSFNSMVQLLCNICPMLGGVIEYWPNGKQKEVADDKEDVQH